ncbi:MAG TPA: GPR endopeptidase [Acholeplasmataceae bacterium]|nr:GPR endopeptidase [Acholeplasmataceae bacterium]
MEVNKISVRTDLAFEAVDGKTFQHQDEIINEDVDFKKVKIKKTTIKENGAKECGRKPGVYYLIDISGTDIHDTDDLRNIEDAVTKVLKEVLQGENININSKGLIVGLGNDNVTPDALGPMVVDNVIVTRHMFMLGEEVSEGISNVSAIAPGVMGTTGIETSDIINAVIEKIDVDYIIAVDALASSSISRVNRSIQITNTGISPGSGVGNKRKELSKEVLNIPVIAIGVPTVVDAVTITANTIDYLLRFFNKKLEEGNKESDRLVISEKTNFEETSLPDEKYTKHFLGEFGNLSDNQKASLIHSVLTPNGLNMMVTPKEIDIDIADLADVISTAIDRSLHTIVEP